MCRRRSCLSPARTQQAPLAHGSEPLGLVHKGYPDGEAGQVSTEKQPQIQAAAPRAPGDAPPSLLWSGTPAHDDILPSPSPALPGLSRGQPASVSSFLNQPAHHHWAKLLEPSSSCPCSKPSKVGLALWLSSLNLCLCPLHPVSEHLSPQLLHFQANFLLDGEQPEYQGSCHPQWELGWSSRLQSLA